MHPLIREFVLWQRDQLASLPRDIDDVLPEVLRWAGIVEEGELLAIRQILTAQGMTVEQGGDPVIGRLTMFLFGLRIGTKAQRENP